MMKKEVSCLLPPQSSVRFKFEAQNITTVSENKTNRERQDRKSTAWRSCFPLSIGGGHLVQYRVSFEKPLNGFEVSGPSRE